MNENKDSKIAPTCRLGVGGARPAPSSDLVAGTSSEAAQAASLVDLPKPPVRGYVAARGAGKCVVQGLHAEDHPFGQRLAEEAETWLRSDEATQKAAERDVDYDYETARKMWPHISRSTGLYDQPHDRIPDERDSLAYGQDAWYVVAVKGTARPSREPRVFKHHEPEQAEVPPAWVFRQHRRNRELLPQLLDNAAWAFLLARALEIGPTDWSAPASVGRERERVKHWRKNRDVARNESILRELAAPRHERLTQKQLAELYQVSESQIQKLNAERKRMLLDLDKISDRLERLEETVHHQHEETVSILLAVAGDPVSEAEMALEEEAGD